MKTAKRERIIKQLRKIGLKDCDFAHPSWCANGIALTTENSERVGNYEMAGIGGAGFDDFGVRNEINKVAEKNGCFTEWENGAVLTIVEI